MAFRLSRAALSHYIATGQIDGLAVDPPQHKYRAKPVVVDAIRFASTKESRRYSELRLLARSGQIDRLELQPRYPIVVVGPAGPVVCGHYTADFRYVDTATGSVVVEDTKSGPTRTTAYRLRKRLVEALHGITIREI